MLRFGIVVPNLNNTKYLTTAIESIVCQNISKAVALIDGGSTDGVERIAKKYNDVIDYFQSKEDSGQSHAIAVGTQKIDGDIFCWLNSDDYYFPNSLYDVKTIFQKHPDVDVVYGDAIHVTPNGSFISYFHPIKEHNKKRIGYDNYICQPACFVRKSAYERIGGIRKDLIYTMDWDLWCRLSESDAKFYYLKKPLAAVRYYKGTKTFSNTFRRYWELFRVNCLYGSKLFPISLIGANYYEISLKPSRNHIERIYIQLIEWMQHLKKKITAKYNQHKMEPALYGLQRWNNWVEGECDLYFPRYSDFNWKEIRLRVTNSHLGYEVHINNKHIDYDILDKETLLLRIDEISSQQIAVHIKSNREYAWQLKEVVCNGE